MRERQGEGEEAPCPRVPLSPCLKHVAIIMDGNGRWAQARGLPRLAGHRAGTKNLRRVIEGCVEYGVQILTIYAFSTENWGRPGAEVRGLMGILEEVIEREVQALHEEGVQLRHIGRLDGLPEKLQRLVREAIELTKDNRRLILNVAFNYGGRAEILDAVRAIIRDGIQADQVNEALFGQYLYTAGLPDPALVIRTGGEMRLSNFLIWQAVHAEYYSTPTFWPDFDQRELYRALRTYQQRKMAIEIAPVGGYSRALRAGRPPLGLSLGTKPTWSQKSSTPVDDRRIRALQRRFQPLFPAIRHEPSVISHKP